jgi:hypothetical protein
MAAKHVAVEAIGSYFECMTDPRHTRNRKHQLLDIVVLAVCGGPQRPLTQVVAARGASGTYSGAGTPPSARGDPRRTGCDARAVRYDLGACAPEAERFAEAEP